jgi:LemA protein
MEIASIFLLVLFALIIFILFYWIILFNRLVRLRNRFKNAFSQIDVQLKRRYDLIPNLVETAKAYMKHEREVLEAVVNARSKAMVAEKRASQRPDDPEAIFGLSGAENMLGSSLGRLFALAEAYPDLKANENMMQLSEELTSTENKISFARQAFNDQVMFYNIACEVFPGIIVANAFNFQAAKLFELESPDERKTPKVSTAD